MNDASVRFVPTGDNTGHDEASVWVSGLIAKIERGVHSVAQVVRGVREARGREIVVDLLSRGNATSRTLPERILPIAGVESQREVVAELVTVPYIERCAPEKIAGAILELGVGPFSEVKRLWKIAVAERTVDREGRHPWFSRIRQLVELLSSPGSTRKLPAVTRNETELDVVVLIAMDRIEGRPG